MTNNFHWGGQDPEKFTHEVLRNYGIDDNPVGKHFQLIVHDPNDPYLIRGIIGSIQVGAEGWLEMIFLPTMHITSYLKKDDFIIRGIIGLNGRWGLLLSKLITPFGEMYPMEDIFAVPPTIEFKILA